MPLVQRSAHPDFFTPDGRAYPDSGTISNSDPNSAQGTLCGPGDLNWGLSYVK